MTERPAQSAPRCKPWCSAEVPPAPSENAVPAGHTDDGAPMWFCSDACADAGRPLNPAPTQSARVEHDGRCVCEPMFSRGYFCKPCETAGCDYQTCRLNSPAPSAPPERPGETVQKLEERVAELESAVRHLLNGGARNGFSSSTPITISVVESPAPAADVATERPGEARDYFDDNSLTAAMRPAMALPADVAGPTPRGCGAPLPPWVCGETMPSGVVALCDACAGPTLPAGQAPPGFRVAKGWHAIDDEAECCDKCETQARYERLDGMLACDAHAVQTGALEPLPAEQPAPTCTYCGPRESCAHCEPHDIDGTGQPQGERPSPTKESILAAVEAAKPRAAAFSAKPTRELLDMELDAKAEQLAPRKGYCTRCKEDVVIDGHKCPPWQGVCACNAGDPVFHSHYRDEPHKCARCIQCGSFRPEAANSQAAPDGGRLSGIAIPHGNMCGYCNRRFTDGERMCCDAGYLADKLAAAERERDDCAAAQRAAAKAREEAEEERDVFRQSVIDAWKAKDEALAKERAQCLAVAKERARCLAWAKFAYYESWMTGGQLMDAIRDGKPAPTS